MTDLERCMLEQKRCAESILSDAPDKAGARLGLNDWTAEECLIRDEMERL